MEEYLIVFHYQAYSFHCERILLDLGLETHFMPTPKKYGELCANALRVKGMEQKELEETLRQQGIDHAGVHVYRPSRLAEIFLGKKLRPKTEDVFGKIRADQPLDEAEIVYLYHLDEAYERDAFFQLALALKEKTVGQKNAVGIFYALDSGTNYQALGQTVERLLMAGEKQRLLFALDTGIDVEAFLQFAVALEGKALVLATGSNALFSWFGRLRKVGVKQIFKGLTERESLAYEESTDLVLAEILSLWHEGKNSLLGISPFLPVLEKTKLPQGRMITALLRVLFRDAEIPAFNVLTAVRGEAQLFNREAGADLFFVDLTAALDGVAQYQEMEALINRVAR